MVHLYLRPKPAHRPSIVFSLALVTLPFIQLLNAGRHGTFECQPNAVAVKWRLLDRPKFTSLQAGISVGSSQTSQLNGS
ncbi:hypothetical protein DFH09DRAFT_81861 [Mycena vulgaris]|nr:hypothetical protein DFH09DRAFT_81861 [Mycena vulgaris]